MITVIYLENGLNPHLRRVEQVPTATIRELAPEWQIAFVAFVAGKPVLRKDWDILVEEDSVLAFIEADAIPQGGGGGSSPLRTVLMIAVMVAAPYAATAMLGITGAAALGAVGVSMFTAGVAMVGMALVNAIAPPPKPTTPQQATALAAPSPTYSLQAQGNSARLEAAIPEHFGRMICYPDFAAQPYAEYAGNEQYLYQLLCIGRGEYDLEGIKIEDTPISSFDEVTTQVVQPYGQLWLFPASVTTSLEVSGQTLSTSVVGPFVANASGTLANRLAFDFVAPRGVYYANDDGSLSERTVYISIDIATVDDYGNVTSGWLSVTSGTQYSTWTDWTLVSYLSNPSNPNTDTELKQWQVVGSAPVYNSGGNLVNGTGYYLYSRSRSTSTGSAYSAASTTAQRWSWSYDVAPGRYTARVSRAANESTASREADSVVWAGLRAYHPDDVGKNYGDVTLLAVKFRASDNLSGQASRKINVIATRKLPGWNGSSWSANTGTRSPAWPIAYACKQVGLSDAQIDRSGLLALATTCAARGDTFDGRFDNFLSFWEAVTKMAGAVRAKPYMQGGILRVVRDQASTLPVALFSQRNIVKGSFSVNYLMPTDDTADSVDVGYFDDITWQSARVRSTLAGSTALKPAKVDLFGVVQRSQAHREGLYQAACNRFRRKIISFQTEMEGFIPSFGDLIAIQHDMPAWGQGGEVVTCSTSSNLTAYSEQFDGKTESNVTCQSNSGIAPNGAMTADTLTITALSDPYTSSAAYPTGSHVQSVFVKQGGAAPSSRAVLRPIIFATTLIDYYMSWDFATKTFSGASGIHTGRGYIDYGNGWYRLWVAFPTQAGQSSTDTRVIPGPDAVGSTMLAWGVQVTNGDTLQDYVPTTSSAVHVATVLTLSEPPTWGIGTHYIALRKRDGSVDGPYACTAGGVNQVVLASTPAITPYTGMNEERTHYAFGASTTWRQPARVLSAKPQSLQLVTIEAVNEDDSVHTADTGVTMPVQVFSQLAGFQNAPVVTDVTAHPAPFAPSKLLIAWQPAAWADHYYVEQSGDGVSWTRCASVAGGNNIITQKLYGAATVVRVAAVGLSRGPWMQVAVTPSPVPETVATLTLDGVKLSWPAVSDQDIVGYRIKFQYGSNLEWGTANLLYDGLVTSSPYVMQVVPPGLVSIMVRAVDSEGQESAASAYVIKDLGDPLTANVLESYDFKVASWPGTISNAAPSGGNLLATQGDAFYRVDASDFYSQNAAEFYSDNYDSMTWESAGWTPSAAAAGYNLSATWTLTGTAPKVEYRQTGALLFFDADAAAFYLSDDASRFYDELPPWQPWPGSVVAEAQEYQWRVLTGAGPGVGLLSAFVVAVDVPDKMLKLNGIAIASGGTRLTGAIGQFNAIQNVQLTLQGGSTAVLLEVQDKSLTLGPLITAKNAAGAGVAATIDALLQGY